ncbi:MAG: penicillin-binding transpeptidase domain-containing protein [Actinobacteria bacterium]|nr:penicillin-binding transpeptidase domain-containing protein [Actinomycetota bacterium]
MSRQVRRLAALLGVLLGALLLNLTWIQVLHADEYRARSGNTRLILEEYNRERGPILVNRSQVARSVRTDDSLNSLRVYKPGAEYAPATGFYSLVYGATGLERTENSVLSGSDSRFFVDRIQQLFAGTKTKGGGVVTTLNSAAQDAAWEGLGGRKGAVVAINPTTGAILALVSSPSFDPNLLSSHKPDEIRASYKALESDPDKPLLNRPLAITYPPGSTFKLVTTAAALESGKFTPTTIIPGPAEYQLPNSTKKLKNWSGQPCGPDGKITLEEALAVSCNTAFAWLGNELGADALRAEAEKFGFNTSFQVPMTAATSRFPANPDAAQTAQSAIGQFDVRATALQMAMVGAAIGNGGVTMNPYLVDQILAPDLSVLSQTQASVFAQAMSQVNAAAELAMMVNVVDHGTGSNAQIPGVRVGGKTGTAQTGNDLPPHAWFVGVAPAEAPQIAVAVVVENGGGSPEISGNKLAAPIARAVIEAVLGS